ncbi:MAG: helix-turn-helix transcriptional regulator [Chloroflexia bacterium]
MISGVVSLQLGQVQLRAATSPPPRTALAAALTNAERTGHTLLRVGALTALARVRRYRACGRRRGRLLRRARQAAEATGSSYLGTMIGPDLADTGDHDDELALLEPLSPRERDVLRLLSQGLTNRAIAGRLHVAPTPSAGTPRTSTASWARRTARRRRPSRNVFGLLDAAH